MKKRPLTLVLVMFTSLIVTGYGFYRLGLQSAVSTQSITPIVPSHPQTQAVPMTIAQGEDATRRHLKDGLKAGDIDPLPGKKILYYHDPMMPASKFEQPGKSPFMDMMLVPVYADAGDAESGSTDQSKITISPRMQQNLGVRTALVSQGQLSPKVSAVGNIAFNERDQVLVQARATAYIEHLYVRATLDPVAKGQALADLYVPDWIAAQEEFLSIRHMQNSDLTGLLDGARQRMRQLGMSDTQILAVENSGKPQPRITLNAPIGGIVTELIAREGMTVSPGASLFRINGLSSVWANAEIPEGQAAPIRPGLKVEAFSAASRETILRGTVQAILPEVNDTTRTIKARVELFNPRHQLLPGMSVNMQLITQQGLPALLIPTEAVIQTGQRTVVILAEEHGRFRAVEIQIGIESNDKTEVKHGLKLGQRVVVSSQFLIDSEANLKGVEAHLNAISAANGENKP